MALISSKPNTRGVRLRLRLRLNKRRQGKERREMDIMGMAEMEEMKGFTHIMNLLFSFVQPMVLKSLVQLGLPDIINTQAHPLTLAELSRALPFESVDQDRLHRILRYSVQMGLFTVVTDSDGQKRYGLTPASKFLVRDGRESLSPVVLTVMDEDLSSPYHSLSSWLDGKVSVTPLELKHGKTFWEVASAKPELRRAISEGTAAITRSEMPSVVRDGRDAFQNISSLVDVGGGTGMAARCILKTFPHIKCCTVLDRPEVVAGAPDCPNVTFIPGDMFAFIPTADAILLKNVLQDWGDADCVSILKQCKKAIGKDGGKIIIVDMVLEENGDTEDMFNNLRLAMDVSMMLFGGRERTREEWGTLVHTAGMDISKITHTSSSQSIIEAYPI